MASSTTMPMASMRPNRVSRLMENPSASMPAKGADQRDKDRHRADDRGPKALQKEIDDEHDKQDRLDQGVNHLLDGKAHEIGGVESDRVLDAVGQRSFQAPPRSWRTALETARPFAPGCW